MTYDRFLRTMLLLFCLSTFSVMVCLVATQTVPDWLGIVWVLIILTMTIGLLWAS
jgi:hypothetical protein